MNFSNKLFSGLVLCSLVFLTGCIKVSAPFGHSKKQGSCKAHECKDSSSKGYSFGEKCFIAEKTSESACSGGFFGLAAGYLAWLGALSTGTVTAILSKDGTKISDGPVIGSFFTLTAIGTILGSFVGGAGGYFAAKHDVDNKCEHDCFCKYEKKRFRFFT